MAGAGTSVEASAVEAAYEAQVQTLFKQLATGLGDLGGTPQAEKESLKRFTVGLAHAKRAKRTGLGRCGERNSCGNAPIQKAKEATMKSCSMQVANTTVGGFRRTPR